MKLTAELIKAGGKSTGRGYSWNAEQLALLGISWPASHGWIAKLEGQEISEETYERFLAAREARRIPRQLF